MAAKRQKKKKKIGKSSKNIDFVCLSITGLQFLGFLTLSGPAL